MPHLNHGQREALKEIQRLRNKGQTKGVLILPTGVGKTYVAAIDAKRTSKKILYVAHQDQILFQARDTFEELTNLKTGLYIAEKKQIEQVTFATIQTLIRYYKKFDKKEFDLIIVDECHHSQAPGYKKVLSYFTPRFVLGLTATPYRMDNKDIFELCGKPYYIMKLRDAIQTGLLSRINYYYVDNDINFVEIQRKFGRYSEKELNKKILIPKYDAAVLKEFNQNAKDKKTIMFCATIEHVHRMKKLFDANKIDCTLVHSGMRKKLIRENIAAFRSGKKKLILVRDIFNEGIDIPDCDCVMLLRPTESKTVFEQQIGRGLRRTKGKKSVLILDFTGNCFNNKFNLEVIQNLAVNPDFDKEIRDVANKQIRPRKDVVVYDTNVTIRLNKTKIDVIRNFAGNIEGRKQILLDNYFAVEKRLGHPPVADDFHGLGPGLSVESYRRVFGSWRSFREYIGRPILTTKDEVLFQIAQFKEKHGHFPTTRELRKNKMILDGTIRRLFGSYENMLIESGGENEVRIHWNITKEKIIDDFKIAKEKLKRVPKLYELERTVNYDIRGAIRKNFGLRTYVSFLESLDEIPPLGTQRSFHRQSKKLLLASAGDVA